MLLCCHELPDIDIFPPPLTFSLMFSDEAPPCPRSTRHAQRCRSADAMKDAASAAAGHAD